MPICGGWAFLVRVSIAKQVSGPLPTLDLLLSKSGASPPPIRPEAKTKPTISSLLGGSRLRYWLSPSLKRPCFWGVLQSLYFGCFARFPSGPHFRAVLGGCASAEWHMRIAHICGHLLVSRRSCLTNF